MNYSLLNDSWILLYFEKTSTTSKDMSIDEEDLNKIDSGTKILWDIKNDYAPMKRVGQPDSGPKRRLEPFKSITFVQ